MKAIRMATLAIFSSCLTTSLAAQLPTDPAAAVAAGVALTQADLPAPQPNVLRVWGDTAMRSVLLAWESRFAALHPEVHFENRLMGTDTGMPGLYGGIADLALFGRETNVPESDGYLHTFQYPPLGLELMTGSLDVAGKSYAPVLFVAKDNPIEHLTLAQADRAFGCGQPGEGQPARTWGDLGLTGAWKTRPFHLYTFDLATNTGVFFLRRLQGASRKENWRAIREFRNIERPDGSIYEAGQQTMDALRADPDGLAVSGLQYAESDVKPLPLAVREDSAYVLPTRESLIDRSYPLTRSTFVYVTRPPGSPVRDLVRQFLLFVYGPEGQSIVAGQHGFLPLTPAVARQQVELLH